MQTGAQRRLRGFVALFLVAGCAAPIHEDRTAPAGMAAATVSGLQPAVCGMIERLYACGEFYLASQPSPDDLALAKAKGIATIINLRYESEVPQFDEGKVVADLDLTYVRVPWNGAAELTDEIFDEVRLLLETVDRPALVHCGSGNRVGAVWLPWRVLDCGLSWDDALAEAQLVGLSSPEYEAKAREYIARKHEAFKPSARTGG